MDIKFFNFRLSNETPVAAPKEIPLLVILPATEPNVWPFYGSGVKYVCQTGQTFLTEAERTKAFKHAIEERRRYLGIHEAAAAKLRADLVLLETYLDVEKAFPPQSQEDQPQADAKQDRRDGQVHRRDRNPAGSGKKGQRGQEAAEVIPGVEGEDQGETSGAKNVADSTPGRVEGEQAASIPSDRDEASRTANDLAPILAIL